MLIEVTENLEKKIKLFKRDEKNAWKFSNQNNFF